MILRTTSPSRAVCAPSRTSFLSAPAALSLRLRSAMRPYNPNKASYERAQSWAPLVTPSRSGYVKDCLPEWRGGRIFSSNCAGTDSTPKADCVEPPPGRRKGRRLRLRTANGHASGQ